MKLLVQNEATINAQAAGISNTFALSVAAELGHVDITEFLLDSGALVDMQSAHGVTALMAAAQSGHLDIVHLLLRHKAAADIQAVGNQNVTALILAANNGHDHVVQALLQADAQIDLANVVGVTPLMFAAQNGHTEIVTLLIKNGATVNAQAAGINNQSALMFASFQGEKDSLCALLDANADIFLQDTGGNTALCLGAENCKFAVVNQFLTYLPKQTNQSIRNCFTGLLALHRLQLVYDEHGDATLTCESANEYRLPRDIRRLLSQHVVRSFMAEPVQRNEQHVALKNNNNQTASELALTASEAARRALANLNTPDQEEERSHQEALAEEGNHIAHLLDVNNPEARLERRKLVWNQIAGVLLANPASEAGSEYGSEDGLDSEEESGTD